MKALDTNILVRFLVGDDENQAGRVYRLFKTAEENKEKFWVPLLVVLELVWVLESVYDIKRIDVLNSLNELLMMPILEFESASILREFLLIAEGLKGDLSDLLIACTANAARCEKVLTFDKNAARTDFFELLK